MLVIPAIDLKDGKCVRLVQGDMDQSTVYGHDPLKMALHWEKEGATLLHIVDLDGAVCGNPVHEETIGAIVRSLKIPSQVGGGIRTMETIEMFLAQGISRVILGTAACEDPKFLSQACRRFPGQVGVGIDAREGRIATQGWKTTHPVTAIELARRSEDAGAAVLVCTDISRDGTESGVNAQAVRAIIDVVSTPVIASGGVRSLDDIRLLKALGKLQGVIVGKALYTGSMRLSQAISEAQTSLN